MTIKFMILVIFIKVFASSAERKLIYKENEIKELLDSGLVDNEKYSLVPRYDGTFELLNVEEIKKMSVNKKVNTNKVRGKHGGRVNSRKPTKEYGDNQSWNAIFHLYTKKNRNKSQVVKEVSGTNFDPKKPTKFIIHGWLSNYTSPVNTVIRKAILDNCDCNVIVVDWSYFAASLNYAHCALDNVPIVAEGVARFIDFLNVTGGMKFEDLTLIGHSLGAHVSGLVGQNVKNGKVAVIIGLDPAAPLFSYSDFDKRLSADDATYVQTIHTNTELLGFRRPMGHASFYPNGGQSQPGCDDATCSHGRAYEYYGESLYANRSFVSYKCYEKSEEKNCSLETNIRMGGELAREHYPTGIFYVPINNVAPYSAIYTHGDGELNFSPISVQQEKLFLSAWRSLLNPTVPFFTFLV